LSKEEREVNASSDVTLALRRTHDMMAAELSRSQFAHDTLKESTAALAQLGETYSTLDTLLSSSKTLLGTLLRSQKSDTWYLETAFYVLLTTIAWLVFRRFLYGPMWWFVWFPLQVFYKAWIGVFAAMGLIGGGRPDNGVSSSVVHQTVVHNSATRASRPTVPLSRGHSVNVGGGGKGGPMKPRETAHGQPDETMSEQVGRIIDESHSGRVVDREATEKPVEAHVKQPAEEEAQRNPKKRMWEEEKEAVKEAQRTKDEL
jgi:protein transport protein SEC20